MSEDITLAKMVRISTDPIVLPGDFQKVMGQNGNAIMILAVSTKTVRIIPTASPEIVKVGLEIRKLTPEYLKQMSETFVKHNLKVIYSTGFCYKGEKCIYEAYFDPSDLKMSVDELKEIVQTLEGTTKIEVQKIDGTRTK